MFAYRRSGGNIECPFMAGLRRTLRSFPAAPVEFNKWNSGGDRQPTALTRTRHRRRAVDEQRKYQLGPLFPSAAPDDRLVM